MRLFQRLFQGISTTALGVVVVTVLGWSSIIRYGVEQNLAEYAKAVRAGSCSTEEKERLLDLIDELEDRIDEGEDVSTFRWIRHDQAIRPLLKNGLNSDDARLLERELLKVRFELLKTENEKAVEP